jgi:hypothetical protein
LSQGDSLSEFDALQKIQQIGFLPSSTNVSDPVTQKEMNLFRTYIDSVKPLKLVKPVISEARRQELVTAWKTAGYKINTDFPYSPFCNYLHWGYPVYKYLTTESAKIKPDADGIPQVNYYGSFYYNPLTIAQFALAIHGMIDTNYQDASNTNYYNKFVSAVDKLLSLMESSGAIRMPFDYRVPTGTVLKKGWVSAVVQSQALSAFARAYRLTNDTKYLIAGNKCLYYMTHPKGGVQTTLKDISPELGNYIFFDAYPVYNTDPTKPCTYTLDDFFYTILGLYDWWQINPLQQYGNHAVAKLYFDKSLETLRYILPLFDLGGYAAYDLSHITYNRDPYIAVGYMQPYVELLGAIYSITNDPWINYYKNLWSSYVE